MKTPAVLALLLLSSAAVSAQVTVTISPTVRFQTIEGWGHGSMNLGVGWAAADPVNYQYIDYLTDDLGLTGTRINEVGPRSDGSGNDNGDCDEIDWSKFQPGSTKQFDYMVYFKNRVRAEGYHPSFYSSSGYASLAAGQKPWMVFDPGERAQQIWANAVYWRDHYGLDMDYAVIANEPNGNWSPKVLADDIKALGPRLAARGLKTRIQFPEGVAPKTSWEYITADKDDAEMWSYVGRISYHVYGTANPYRAYIRDFGAAVGLPTAQTEMDPNNIDNLFDDLTLGGVSYWEVAYSDSNTVNPNPGYTSFTPSPYYFRIRQVTHYVRPGAIRIETTSSEPAVRALAFLQHGAVTAVVYNTGTTPQTITVAGLPAGRYGLSRAAPTVIAFEEVGVRTVGADGTTTMTLGKGVTATLYPHPATNLPPTIMTWGSKPGVIEAPISTASLSVTANDPEQDPLTYRWAVLSQPRGATATIADPTSARTAVSGLTVTGTYIFKIDVGDGVNTTSEKAYLIRYGSNQPPVLGFTGFRLARPYGVVLQTPDPGGALLHTRMALPTSSGILQANVSDLENDRMTARWSVVSQPTGAAVPRFLAAPGATVRLDADTSDPEGDLLRHWWVIKSAPPGARPVFDHQELPHTTVSGLTVPGVYVFTLRVFDDISMTTRDVMVRVAPAAH